MISMLLSVLFLILLYKYSTKNHSYWSKRNVKYETPIPLFGNLLRNLLGLSSWTEIGVELYNKYPEEKVIGRYYGRTPQLIIRDLDLVRQILNVDFSSFYVRGLISSNPRVQPLTANLLHVDGDMWKLLRKALTPAFTIAKLRGMFPKVVNCAERLQKAAGEGGECDAHEMMVRFTIEVIGACGFGIDMDTINNKRSHFLALGKQMFNQPLKNRILWILREIFPELGNVLYVDVLSTRDSLTSIVTSIRKHRGNKPSGQNDFIDLLLELEAKGKIQGNSIEKSNPDGSPVKVEMEMDLKVFVAQVFIFYAAGFETSSVAASFTLHALAYNPDVQSRVQKEIDQVMLKYNNKLCYDSVAEMSLLDMSFKESMRMFPPGGVLVRQCTKRYTIPGLDVTIDPGVKILIPIQAIHMDEKYFDNPKEFRPERFTNDNVQARHKYAYLPFGEGPRACIGENLGRMQSLAGLAAILHKFTVLPAATSRWELNLNHEYNVVQGVQELPIVLKLR